MNTNMTGFQKKLHHCSLEESSPQHWTCLSLINSILKSKSKRVKRVVVFFSRELNVKQSLPALHSLGFFENKEIA